MNTSEQINELASALAKAQAEIESAEKDAENPYFNSAYSTLASVWNACKGPLTKNNLSVSQGMMKHESGLMLVTKLMHSSGQFIESLCPILTTKNDMQGLGSAYSYARRYSLAAIVGVTSDDDDGNAATHPPEAKKSSNKGNPTDKPQSPAKTNPPKSGKPTQATIAQLFVKLKASGKSAEDLKDYMQSQFAVSQTKDLSMEQFEKVSEWAAINPFNELPDFPVPKS